MRGEPFAKRQPGLGIKVFFHKFRPSLLILRFALDQVQTQLSFTQSATDAQ